MSEKKLRKKLQRKSYLRPELKKYPKINTMPVRVFASGGTVVMPT
ncbi:hypothetical protein ACFL2J_03585 [Candidatus Omnitrophota bacterium]